MLVRTVHSWPTPVSVGGLLVDGKKTVFSGFKKPLIFCGMVMISMLPVALHQLTKNLACEWGKRHDMCEHHGTLIQEKGGKRVGKKLK